MFKKVLVAALAVAVAGVAFAQDQAAVPAEPIVKSADATAAAPAGDAKADHKVVKAAHSKKACATKAKAKNAKKTKAKKADATDAKAKDATPADATKDAVPAAPAASN